MRHLPLPLPWHELLPQLFSVLWLLGGLVHPQSMIYLLFSVFLAALVRRGRGGGEQTGHTNILEATVRDHWAMAALVLASDHLMAGVYSLSS